MRRRSLSARLALLCAAVAVVTGVVAAALAVGLIRSSVDDTARATLGRLADAAQQGLDRSPAGVIAATRAKRLLRVYGVEYGAVGSTGPLVSAFPQLRLAISDADIAAVRAGNDVSTSTKVEGHALLVEGRPLHTGGGIFLVQARSTATAGGESALRRTLVAILVAVAVAAVAGALVARRTARPLRRTAAAAHALATGRRDVEVRPEGPAEVAGVADAVNTLAAALNHSESRQREFLLSVSHDLRTPLTAITGYAESLANGVVPAERTAEVGGTVLAEAQRLDRLVGDLLDLARLDARDLRVELTPVDLAAVAGAAAATWQHRCAQVGVQFRLEAWPARAVTDPARVRQALDGLLENALRVTPAGAPIVLATRTDPDGWAVAEVRDGGPGLTPDDIAVAFVRGALYERYRGVRRVGTGFGLAIVHGLISRLGGTVHAGVAAEGGARFTVRLPPAISG
jgi:two-component system, OmpR family, sensor kinase